MSEIEGLVVRAQSREFTVRGDDGTARLAVVPKRLRREHHDLVDPIAVGDRITLEAVGDDWVVRAIHERRNQVARRALGREFRQQLIATNLDWAVIVLSAVDPPWKPATIDRYLVMASLGGVPPLIYLNKIDLDPELPSNPIFDLYPRIGVPVLFGSAVGGEGIEALAERLRGSLAVLIGPSGVGKSSILGRLTPDEPIRVGAVSDRTGKGKHTTTWVELRPLDGGGGLIDSPGLRTLNLSALEPHELAAHFPEFRGPRERCRFRDCHHRAEPRCGVKAEVEDGRIAPSRYESYERIYDSLEAGEG